MIISTISGTLITGVSVFIVLSYLLIPSSITIPISISISLLSLGLIKYYTVSEGKNDNTQSGNNGPDRESNEQGDQHEIKIRESNSIIIFVFLFSASLIICSFFSNPELRLIFKSWNTVDMIGIIGLGAGIVVSFFMPGYAVTLLLTKRCKTNPILKILLAYLFSMLITGLTVYLSEIFFDNDILGNKNFLLSVNALLLIAVVIYYRVHRIILPSGSDKRQIISIISNKLGFLRSNFSELLVFGSLLSLLIISTNYLYGGITIGDQWYHQNRIILFMTGQFKEFVLSNGDEIYPPLQSALLAGLTTLSGIPLVNTFASIAFLNITAVFAFYYFCSIWLPRDKKRAALLASSLFLIAAGFGWVYIISLAETNPLDSQISSITNFVKDKIKVSDIRLSSNFMIAAFPDFSTGLIYIALPAGFVLLGLVRTKFSNRFHYVLILSLVTTLGTVSHDEFYIFVILASTLPLIYNVEKKYSVYLALIISLAFTFALDTLLPVKYFTIQSILGVSLHSLVTLFSLIMLGLYAVRRNLSRPEHSFVSRSIVFGKKIVNWNGKIKLIPKMIFVGIAIYLYLLCFIVWDELPANFVDVHTQKYNTPWYLYPMRLGLIGLIGLASILSYVFKRYEKEVFVFGILIIIALLAGPYYNEQRFNKYVMAGMIGFAAILIFRILRFMSEKKPILNGIIISVIVVSASLSTLMYIGYNALVIQTQNYSDSLDRRNFPSQEELHMYDILRSKIQLGPNPNNIASFANEYNFREGNIMSKLHAFTGLPYMKIAQTEYLLNATTIDLFYHLLENTNTKFMVIPINSINNQTLSNPMKFSLDNFQQIYRDNGYVVLGIPSFHGPSTASQSQVGIVYKKDTSFLSTVQNETQLNVTNSTFNFEKNDMKFIHVNDDNQHETDNITFYGYKKNGGKTIWSKELGEKGINYLDFKFRINGENKTGKDVAGIRWIEGTKTYFLSLSDKGLELRQQVSKDGDYLLLSQNSEIKKNDWTWYSIKIETLEKSVNIYVDDLLKMIVQKNSSEIPIISKVGIFSENNAVDIEPIVTGNIDSSERYYDKAIKYGKYYPISSLALSKSTFSTFIEDDSSALSKKRVILTFDPQHLNDTKLRSYLDYVRSGGTLIVINSDNSTGKFAELFSVSSTANNTEKFSSLIKGDNQNAFMNVNGFVRGIAINETSDMNVVASYFDEETKLSTPFVIQKNLTNNGHITYVNAKGYFDAIYENPIKYFSSLANFSDLLIPNDDETMIPVPPSTSEPIKRFIGDVKMSGKISINGSSFSLTSDSMKPHNLRVETISVLDKYGNMKIFSRNQDITNLEISGQYEVIINSSGSLILPQTLSQNDYMQISLPSEFDMILKILNNGNNNDQVKILISNGSSNNVIVLDTESTILFNNVMIEAPLVSVPVVIKNPVLIMEGDLKFEKTNFYGESNYPSLEISGNATARFDFVDDFKEPYRKGTRTQHISYLESIDIDGKRKQTMQELKLPGDISSDVRKRGLDVPLHSIIGTSNNIALIVTTIIGIAVTTWLIRKTHFSS